MNAQPDSQGDFPIFTIDLSTGDTTKVGDLKVPTADLASGPVCETDETAWVCDEQERVEDFEGANWATYFEYEQCDPDAFDCVY